MSKFITQTTAAINSKEKEQIAAQNARLASTAFRSQIAGLQNQKIDAEIRLEAAVTALNSAITPGVAITDRNSYIRGIVSARAEVTSATEALNSVVEMLNYFTSTETEYFTEGQG